MDRTKVLLAALGLVAAWEGAWWARRSYERTRLYRAARRRANELGLPLVVIGHPENGPTRGPSCGDVTVDLTIPSPNGCRRNLQADISRRLPWADNSVVVFVSCVLEYVEDYEAALRELRRISGGRMYVARVEPWTLTAYLYPGARRTIPAVP